MEGFSVSAFTRTIYHALLYFSKWNSYKKFKTHKLHTPNQNTRAAKTPAILIK